MITPYKVVVRNSPNWRSYSAATLGVSVTSPNWQDEKLAAILDFADQHFSTIRIDVTDALYRHGYMGEGIPPEDALARANSLGALWLTQHAELLNDMQTEPQIIRWAEWYNHADYQETLDGFYRAYELNRNLQQAVHKDAMEFFNRKEVIPSSAAYKASCDYLIEELAIITIQARELPSVKIYPGDELRCFHVVRNGLIPEAPKGLELEQFAKIKFDKRLAFPMQPATAQKLTAA